MQHRSNKRSSKQGWNAIPAGRRHIYVYTLLLLGAVVGNDIRGGLAAPPTDENLRSARAEVSRLEGMKETAVTLYH